jgi:hypothetical protein
MATRPPLPETMETSHALPEILQRETGSKQHSLCVTIVNI